MVVFTTLVNGFFSSCLALVNEQDFIVTFDGRGGLIELGLFSFLVQDVNGGGDVTKGLFLLGILITFGGWIDSEDGYRFSIE